MESTNLNLNNLYSAKSVSNKKQDKLNARLKKPVEFDHFKSILIINYNMNKHIKDSFLLEFYSNYVYSFDKRWEDKTFNFSLTLFKRKLNSKSTTLQYYLDRGYDLEDAKEALRKRQSTCTKEIAKKIQDSLSKNINLDKINKSKGNCNKWEFYLSRINESTGVNYTEYEAKQKIKNKQSKGFTAVWKNHKNNVKEFLCNTSLKYYLNKGLSLDEAKNALSIRQGTNSLEKYIVKYGEIEGIKKFKNRQIKWQKTLNNKTEEEKINLKIKQRINFSRISLSSLKLFDSIVSELNLNLDDVYYNKPEYFIYDDNTKRIYFYDFVIPSKKIAIEYNGIKFHPNPNASDEEKLNWTNLFTKMNYEDNLKFDNYKNSLIIHKGYKLLIVWENDTDNLKKCINFINKNTK